MRCIFTHFKTISDNRSINAIYFALNENIIFSLCFVNLWEKRSRYCLKNDLCCSWCNKLYDDDDGDDDDDDDNDIEITSTDS